MEVCSVWGEFAENNPRILFGLNLVDCNMCFKFGCVCI